MSPVRFASRRPARSHVSAVGAIAGLIVLLTLAGCSQAGASLPKVAATVAPTPTATPAFTLGPQLTWRAVSAP